MTNRGTKKREKLNGAQKRKKNLKTIYMGER